MPGRDGTGPTGMGAMTGRRMGICAGAGLGLRGMGRGRGWFSGNPFPGAAPVDEQDYLKSRADALQAELEIDTGTPLRFR
ncbi:MAG: DUF5320 domain-containing protein [Desulfobacterales bacterium]|nr:DUF5320 domain-containing protein [Desulfobacterales bacterium]